MVRTVLGVVIGDAIFTGSVALLIYFTQTDQRSPSPGFIFFSVLFGIAFALLGGFVAGKISGRADLITGLLLAAIIVIAAIVTAISRPGEAAIWFQLYLPLLMSPAAVFGDWLRKGRR